MGRGKPAREEEMPKVDHGIPMPEKFIDGRGAPNIPPRRQSAWIDFLKSLKVGDSFKVNFWEFACLATHAKKLDIDLVWRDDRSTRGDWHRRVWIYGKGNNRNPIFTTMSGKKYRLDQVK